MIKNPDPVSPLVDISASKIVSKYPRNRIWGWIGAFVRDLSYDIRKNRALLLMALPGLAVVFVISYMPMPGIVLAFKNYRAAQGVWGSNWVGFNNFQFLFNSGTAWQIIRNTLALNALFIIAGQICALTMAVLLNEVYHRQIAKTFQSILFFPHFVSWVLVGFFTYAFLNSDTGYVNAVLKSLGHDSVNWYGEPQYWYAILVFLSVWKGLGYFTIIYLAGMLNISPEYYEAARIDGANKLQEIWYISLPLIRPLIIINVLLAIGRIFFANFDFIFNVTRDSSLILSTTNVIDTFVYRSLTSVGNYNIASAAGVFQALMGLILVLFANALVRRIDKEHALF
ncbi:MAG: sugar ABC transporter permease [Anaerolineae bacterium]|nr:sugar ABC transporter permease [Anaerolineae bacterium]